MKLKENLKKISAELGFNKLHVCKAGKVSLEEAKFFTQWLNNKYHADMKFMEDNIHKRFDPALLFGNQISSVIILTCNYYYNGNEKELLQAKYKISRHALGKNYHKVIKKKLKIFSEEFVKLYNGNIKTYIDSAPVLEKYWAKRSGIGLTGKNTTLIIPELGSYVFLAVCFTDVELDPDIITEGKICAGCNLCIDACPTGALVAPYTLDARKCISYLTIEHKDQFNENTPKWEKWIWGCDICQEVCPHNNNPPETEIKEFRILPQLLSLINGDFISGNFDKLLSETSLSRGRKERISRNINWVDKSR